MAKPKPMPTAPQRPPPAQEPQALPERKEWYLVRVAGGLVAVVEVPMVPDVARAKVAHTGGSLAAARVRAATKLANYNDAVFRERQNPVG